MAIPPEDEEGYLEFTMAVEALMEEDPEFRAAMERMQAHHDKYGEDADRFDYDGTPLDIN